VSQLYLASLSCRSIIYKGMMLAEQVAEFYPDLMDERFESAFAIYHQRYSTNTFPQWWLAQPFRMLAHNGEINTLKGNMNWMKSHEIRMASATFGDTAEDIKPIVASGSSDSAALDAVFEVLVRAGRSAPMAKTMLVPESWSKQATELKQSWRDMYSYCNSVMEPWDGPAALAMTDGRWVCAGLDRNGLRPMRYVVTGDRLLIAGSEAGMVPINEADVVEKGALGPGQMIGVHMGKGELYNDEELKDKMANALPFGEWVGKINELDEDLGAVTEAPPFIRVANCASVRLPPGTRLRSWRTFWPQWPKTPRRRLRRWATIRRLRYCPKSTARCPTSFVKTSLRSPTRQSTACANSA